MSEDNLLNSLIGERGEKGEKGERGQRGPQGFPGAAGAAGPAGPAGAAGAAGAAGSIGPDNSVQMKDGETTNFIGYSSFIYNGQIFTINSSNLKLDMSAIAIGPNAGKDNQKINAVAIGFDAGRNGQFNDAVAIGSFAGKSNQQSQTVAIGYSAGQTDQSDNSVAIGPFAGQDSQQEEAIAIGYNAGAVNQERSAVAIGNDAGRYNQKSNAVAIGNFAGQTNQFISSIVINATGNPLDNTTANSCVIKPIREASYLDTSTNVLMYDTVSGEITVNNGAKTFVIDHPTDSNKYLVHACLEGPEVGVYYRGTGIINESDQSAEIILADYVKHLATDYTVNVTPIYNEKENTIATLATTRVNNGKFKVHSNKPCEFDYVVFGKRNDIVVEPEKTNVEIKGDGPYKWL